MLRGTTKESEIKKYREILRRELDKKVDERIIIRYSTKRGVGEEVEACYSSAHDLWWYFSGKDTQYWNPFGLGKPRQGQAVTGRSQINMPKKGYKPNMGGAFAK